MEPAETPDYGCGVTRNSNLTYAADRQTEGRLLLLSFFIMKKIILMVGLFLAISTTQTLAMCGVASWYGPGFHGKTTASGEKFDQNALTAAHKTLKFGTRVQVTNPKTGKTVTVKINDRGPFVGKRVIDLSKESAKMLGIHKAGVGQVCMKVLKN